MYEKARQSALEPRTRRRHVGSLQRRSSWPHRAKVYFAHNDGPALRDACSCGKCQ